MFKIKRLGNTGRGMIGLIRPGYLLSATLISAVLISGCVSLKNEGQTLAPTKLSRKGKWIYSLGNGSNDVIFSWYDPQKDSFTRIASYASGRQPYQLAHANGKFLYVANTAGDTITVYSIDQSSGELTQVEKQPTQSKPNNFTFNAAANMLYVTHHSSDSLIAYKVDSETGALEQHQVISSNLDGPIYSDFSPDGTKLLVLNQVSSNVSGFDIQSDGTLDVANVQITGAVGVNPIYFLMDPSGTHAYFVSFSSHLISFVQFNSTSLFNWADPINDVLQLEPQTFPSHIVKHPSLDYFLVGATGTGKIHILEPDATVSYRLAVANSPFELSAENEISTSLPSQIHFVDENKFIIADGSVSSKLAQFEFKENSSNPIINYLQSISTPVQNFGLIVLDSPN